MAKIKILVFGLLVGVFNASCSSETETSTFNHMNTSVDPCDDFFEYTCGNFKNMYPLSKDTLTIDHFTLLEEKLTLLVNATLSIDEHIDDPEALKKAKSAYKACIELDFLNMVRDPEQTIVKEEHGFPMVQPKYLQRQTHFGWEEIGESVSKYGIPMIFTITSFPHLKDATKNVIRISSDDLSNPSMIRPYQDLTHDDIIQQGFLEMAQRSSKLKSSSKPAPFDIFLETMALKIGNTEKFPPNQEEVRKNINKMANFMRTLYKGGILPVNQTIEKFGGYTATLKQLNNWMRRHFGKTVKLNWVKYMQKVFKKSGVRITEDTEFLTPQDIEKFIYGIINLVRQTPDDVVKNFVMMRIFLFMAIDSDYVSRSALERYYTQLNIRIPPRWKYCTRKIIDAEGGSVGLSFAVAYEYQLKYYNVNGFRTVIKMLQDLQNSFSEIMSESSLMNDTIKEIALKKLQNMNTIMAFPDFVTYSDKLNKFYKNLRICKWDNYGNSGRIRAFKQAYQLSQLEKRDRTFWDKSPFETNAYYSRANNRIILPIAMINPEFFNTENSILDYGRLGAIIGHEITHGFDTKGQSYDQDGCVTNWGDSTMFRNHTNCFVEQYNNYYISEIGTYVNGILTLNENLADNAGTKEAYRAMKKISNRSETNNGNFNYTDDQLFFIGFGSMWCNNPSLKYLQKMASGDYAPSKWRVNGVVSNMAEFAEAFSCPSGSKMNPVEKCKLW